MATLLLSTLFAASAWLAILAIAGSWHRYGAGFLALRGQIETCPPTRELRFKLMTIDAKWAGAAIYRPQFRQAAWVLPVQSELRAAA